jgi:hypothetical protein
MIFKSKISFAISLALCGIITSCSPREEPVQPPPVTDSQPAPVVEDIPAVVEIAELEDIDGIWVPEKYVESLKATKNPFIGSPESIEINMHEQRLKWTNFHERYWRNIFDYGINEGRHFLKISEPESSNVVKEPVFFSLDNEAMIFNERGIVDQVNERFIKISVDLPKYANQQILAGKYKDKKGKLYEFTEDGKAVWPKLSFDYEVVLDPTEANCPYINSSIKEADGHPKRYGYKWDAEDLHIFEIVDGQGAPISCSKNAYLTLSKK